MHPSILRIAPAMQRHSSARTPAGLLRAWRARSPRQRKLAVASDPSSVGIALMERRATLACGPNAWPWHSRQRECSQIHALRSGPLTPAKRQPDPLAEAKRAKNDPVFRRSYLARLTREETALVTLPQLTLGNLTLWHQGELARRRAALTGIALARQAAGVTRAPRDLPRWPAALLPVSPATAERVGATVCRRGRDWSVSPTYLPSYIDHTPGETTWKNGVPKSYKRAQITSMVRAFGLLLAPDRLAVALHESELALTLPEGWTWHLDSLGIVAAGEGTDHHPTAAECLAGVDWIIATARSNRDKRELALAEARAEAAELAGVYVCLADSLRGGNCRAGSQSFAAQHGLDHRAHHSPSKLLSQSNGHTAHVRLAIASALRRHRQEIARGYSILADHSA